ncbi:hypothetical protein [Caballeronia sp. INDeC2]|uniref:hypothetical protein n=1 Tax=Caballeronia sp. INDeC2 TaxID=2921747 RepID=UPI002029459B|nr:hypothetical protein [Caballeronia sp. INDeC2]
MQNNRIIDTYFRFLNLSHAMHALPSAPKLDAGEIRLLEALATSWHAGHALTVKETMSLPIGGAPATLHRKLTRLKNLGLVSMDEKADDMRAKTVSPTRSALDYFEKIAACFDEARAVE